MLYVLSITKYKSTAPFLCIKLFILKFMIFSDKQKHNLRLQSIQLHKLLQKKAVVKYAEFEKKWWDEYWKDANTSNYKDDITSRQLFFVKQLGNAVLPSHRLEFVRFYPFCFNL